MLRRMLKPGQLYFAYGCNMDGEHMRSVIGGDVGPGWPARLDDWTLSFDQLESDGSLVATLHPCAGCATYGVVFRLPRESLPALDAFEEYPAHYRRETLWVEPLGRRARQAVTVYIGEEGRRSSPGAPRPEYLSHLLSGASQHGLPNGYVEWLRRRANGEAAVCYRAED